MAEIKLSVLDKQGQEVKTISLSENVFGIEPHKQAMYDALKMQMASLRQGNADTKGRSEVRGGGKKPYKQKGTGRARRGHSRSPIMVGGGTVFGPTPRSYAYHINKKVYALAMRSLLSEKVLEKNLKVIDDISMPEIKTKEFVKVMEACKLEKKTLFVLGFEDDCQNTMLSGGNLPNVAFLFTDEITALDLANADTVVCSEAAIKLIEEDYK